ncbi:GerMN domain-containing protein [Defluviitalea saccharophila]|uniref:GerMN domain-containing protein n=1 Tax=Defluviitalea saccharophila TaxID=879970 RepID=A0ABZ2Y6W3_9FIRM
MNGSTYFFILLFMGLMFVSPAFSQQSLSNPTVKEKKVEELFEALLGDTSREGNLIPEGTKLIHYSFENHHLILNFSEDIKNYGGTATEQWIVYKILSTGFSIPEVESITVLIEGRKDYLPEGTIIDGYKKEVWLEERMKSEWRELTKENTG